MGIVQWASAAIQDVLGSGVERDICPCRVRDVQFQVEAGTQPHAAFDDRTPVLGPYQPPSRREFAEPFVVLEVAVGVGGDQDQVDIAADARSVAGIGADEDQPDDVDAIGGPRCDGGQQRGDLTAATLQSGAHVGDVALRAGLSRVMAMAGSMIRPPTVNGPMTAPQSLARSTFRCPARDDSFAAIAIKRSPPVGGTNWRTVVRQGDVGSRFRRPSDLGWLPTRGSCRDS